MGGDEKQKAMWGVRMVVTYGKIVHKKRDG